MRKEGLSQVEEYLEEARSLSLRIIAQGRIKLLSYIGNFYFHHFKYSVQVFPLLILCFLLPVSISIDFALPVVMGEGWKNSIVSIEVMSKWYSALFKVSTFVVANRTALVPAPSLPAGALWLWRPAPPTFLHPSTPILHSLSCMHYSPSCDGRGVLMNSVVVIQHTQRCKSSAHAHCVATSSAEVCLQRSNCLLIKINYLFIAIRLYYYYYNYHIWLMLWYFSFLVYSKCFFFLDLITSLKLNFFIRQLRVS